MLLNNIKFSIIISLITLSLKILYKVILHSKLKSINRIEIKLLLIEFVFSFILFFTLTSVITFFFYKTSILLSFLISSIASIGLITYQFVLEPAFKYLNEKKYKSIYDYENVNIIKDNDIKIYVFESEKINAFATGIIPGLKFIFLSSKLISIMTNKEIEAIIYHEIGHIKKNHLMKLYVLSIVVLIPGLICSSLIINTFTNKEMIKILVIVNGCIFFGLIPLLIMSFFQKKYEFEADAYSSKQTKNEDIINALIKMNINTNLSLEKKSLSHPILSKRISNVKKNNNS